MGPELAGRLLEAVDVQIAVTEAAVGLIEFGKRLQFGHSLVEQALTSAAVPTLCARTVGDIIT